MANDPVVRVAGLGKQYHTAAGPVPALTEINLGIYPGEFVAVMGPSGSGNPLL